MASQSDLDQSGTVRQWVKSYLGPSIGWVSAPVRNILKITAGGTYHLDTSVSLVEVDVNAAVIIVLPSCVSSKATAQAQPGTYVQNPIIVADVGGFAFTQNIIVQPNNPGETIAGAASLTIGTNYGGFVFQPFSDLAQWNTMPPSGTGGSVGSPGGPVGSVQYNNAGAFGGFTVSGDALINTATGVATVQGLQGKSISATAPTQGQELQWSGTTWLPTRTVINALLYGLDPTGTNDNSPLMANVFAALGSTGGTIYFPRGKYKFLSSVTYAYPTGSIYHVTLLGDGADASILFFPNSNGFIIQTFNNLPTTNVQSFDTRDIAFTTGALPSANWIGLNVSEQISNSGSYAAANNFFRTTFRGDDGYTQFNGWNIGLRLNNTSNVNVDSCIFNGPATAGGQGINYGNNSTTTATANFTSGVSTTISVAASGVSYIIPGQVVYDLDTNLTVGTVQTYSGTTVTLTAAAQSSGSSGNRLAFGIPTGLTIAKTIFQQLIYGCQLSSVFQGLTVNSGQFNGCSIGIYAPATVSSISSMIIVADSQFGMFASGTSGITLSATITTLIVKGCLFLVEASNSNAINQLTSSHTNIADNQFLCATTTTTTGIQIGGSVSLTTAFVNDNIFAGFGTGLLLGATSTVYARPNKFINCSININNSGPTNTYGTNFGSAKPANPTGTSSAVGVMMGLGTTCTFAPFRTTIKVTFNFTVATSGAAGTVFVVGRYGTGSVPANGAGNTGTGFGGTIEVPAAVAVTNYAATITDVIAGVSTNVSYWFDMNVQCTGGSSATPIGISFDVFDVSDGIYG